MGKLVGYARVSKQDQDLSSQIDALLKVGCKKNDIYVDKISGARADRPGLNDCLASVETGDTLIVWRLDRLGRSMSHLVGLVEGLRADNIGFKSLCDGAIDTTTASGELVFNMFSSLAQFERRLIQERTKAGLDAARARGRKGGRRKILTTDPKVLAARKMHENRNMSIGDICTSLRLSKSTLYRYLKLG